MNALLPICALVPVLAAGWFVSPATLQDPKPTAEAVSDKDRKAVRQAALDYVDGLYETRPELIKRSVSANLKKFGFYRRSATKPYRTMPMSYEQLVKLAGSWNKDGTQADKESLKKIEILDVMDTTAVVKLSAVWGVDYMQLGKFDGRWQILHILWQSHPKTN